MTDGKAGAPDCARVEAALLEAHAANAPENLSVLYSEVAEMADRAGERDRAAFFLTHAWIFALEAGLASAEDLRARLRARGCVD